MREVRTLWASDRRVPTEKEPPRRAFRGVRLGRERAGVLIWASEAQRPDGATRRVPGHVSGPPVPRGSRFAAKRSRGSLCSGGRGRKERRTPRYEDQATDVERNRPGAPLKFDLRGGRVCGGLSWFLFPTLTGGGVTVVGAPLHQGARGGGRQVQTERRTLSHRCPVCFLEAPRSIRMAQRLPRELRREDDRRLFRFGGRRSRGTRGVVHALPGSGAVAGSGRYAFGPPEGCEPGALNVLWVASGDDNGSIPFANVQLDDVARARVDTGADAR